MAKRTALFLSAVAVCFFIASCKKTGSKPAETEQAANSAPIASVTPEAAPAFSSNLHFISREKMPEMAAQGSIQDITNAVLSSNLPEAYYAGSWVDGRIYGFTVYPPAAGSFLIYNRALLSGTGIGVGPGDFFNRGRWGWDDFFNYCLVVNNLLPEESAALDVDAGEFFVNILYANGGYLVHPETGAGMENTSSMLTALEYTRRLAEGGILGTAEGNAETAEKFLKGETFIVAGDTGDLEAYLQAGMNIGVVPYPWGPNVKVRRGFQSIEDMLAGNYRTLTGDYGVFTIAKDSGLKKSEVMEYIAAAFRYANREEALETDRERERQGLQPAFEGNEVFDEKLSQNDYMRLEWILSRPALPMPEAGKLPDISQIAGFNEGTGDTGDNPK